MEGKGPKGFVIIVLVLGLVLEQIQVEATKKSCCPSSTARNIYNLCRFQGTLIATCAKLSHCQIVDVKCDYPYIRHSLHSNSDEANALEFCKLGCASSVCNNVKAAVGNEEANDIVDRRDEACYSFCTKHVDTAATTVVS